MSPTTVASGRAYTGLRQQVTPAMRVLRGLARDVLVGSGRTMGLLPVSTDPDQAWLALRARARTSGIQVGDRYGSWMKLTATRDQLRLLLDHGVLQYAEAERRLTPQGLTAPSDVNLTNQLSYFTMTGLHRTWPQLELGCLPPVVAIIDSGWNGKVEGHTSNLVSPHAWFNAVTRVQGNADAAVPGYVHGMAVASVISMVSNDSHPGSGMANNLVKVLPINAMAKDASFYASDIVSAVEYAVGNTVDGTGHVINNPFPANVINMSFADEGHGGLGEFLTSYLERAASRGVVTVVAAGNKGLGTPSSLTHTPYSIGVGGVDLQGQWWQGSGAGSGSNYGQGVTVAGPAQAVNVLLNGFPEKWEGTSLAAPWVSGQIALWMYANQHLRADRHPTNGLTGQALYEHLTQCFKAIGSHRGVWQEKGGYGVPDTALMVAPTTAACRR